MTLMASPAVLVRILELIHEALYDDLIISKRYRFNISNQDQTGIENLLKLHRRNIYYKDPALFKRQSTVDKYVDIIAYTFGVSRFALNVVSGQRYPFVKVSLILAMF